MTTRSPPIILVSSGEPAGIGPDICCRLATEPVAARMAVLGDPELLAARARKLGLGLTIEQRTGPEQLQPHRAGQLQLLPVACRSEVVAGRLDPSNADYVLAMLERAAALCVEDPSRALVTAPVQKSVIVESGRPFTGHTEYLARLTGTRRAVMLLASDRLRVALATTHLPLRDVAHAITRESLTETLRIIAADFRERFGIGDPRILVLGLNPHAGESGTLGTEETKIITPVVEALRSEGLRLIGPVPADTAFTSESLARADVVLAMYHDQGLPVLKASSFGDIVNVTLGLPIIRTSVDHGTALDLAGSGRARHESLRRAAELAIELAARARK